MPKQTCGTCKWGKFEMTGGKRPRINPNGRAICVWPEPAPPVLPISITQSYGYRHSYNRMGIVAEWSGCPTWEVKA